MQTMQDTQTVLLGILLSFGTIITVRHESHSHIYSYKVNFCYTDVPLYYTTGCPRKQFTLFENALISYIFIVKGPHHTHFEADSASFKMSTHTLHRCQ